MVNERLRSLLARRYPGVPRLAEKCSVIPTGVDCENRYFSEPLRREVRSRLGWDGRFVVAYIGNVYYSWQNLGRTLDAFRLLQQSFDRDFFLLLLIRKQDHGIAREFLLRSGIAPDDYLLDHVPPSEVTGYLNAADLGVLLRHEHLMNQVASPGKFGDYTGCGLPSLISRGVPHWESFEAAGGGVVLRDVDDDAELLQRISPFLEYDPERRRTVARWAREILSTDAHAER